MFYRTLALLPVLGLLACAEEAPSADTSPADPTAGATADPSDDGGPADPTFADVEAIVVAHCQACHSSPAQGAPFSLVSYDDVASRAERIVARAVDGAPSSMPPSGLALSDAEAQTLIRWEELGAPE